MCCPHGHVLFDNPDFDKDQFYDDYDYNVQKKICKDAKIGEYEPQIIENGHRMEWTRNEDFLLVAPEANVFKCDKKYGMEGEFFSIPEELGTFNFLTDGRFQVNLKMSSPDLIY